MSIPDAKPLEKWVRTTIGAVCSKPQYGWTTSAADSGDVKLLRTTDITRGPVDWNTVPYCRDVPPDVDKYLLAEGDIVVSRAGSVGVSCRVVAPERSVFASYLIRFRPKEDVDGKYLTYVLQSPAYWAQVRGSTAGIAIPNVNASKLEAFEIPLAALPEQQRIVAEIEKQFTRLDEGVTALRRVQANLISASPTYMPTNFDFRRLSISGWKTPNSKSCSFVKAICLSSRATAARIKLDGWRFGMARLIRAFTRIISSRFGLLRPGCRNGFSTGCNRRTDVTL